MYQRKGSSRSSSNKKKKTCKSSGKTNPRLVAFEAEFGTIGDYGQDAWNKLDQGVVENLSKTVVPVASFIGNQMHFGCTGIVVRSNVSGVGVLTSASIVRSLDGDTDMTSILRIEVHLPNMQVTGGVVAHYDFHYNVAVIIIPAFPGFRAARFDLDMEFESNSKVVAVGRWFCSGKFMAASGVLTDELSRIYPEHFRISTCKIPMVMTGGPLIDLDGNFVGMNFYSKERTPFLPWNKVFDFLMLKDEIKHEGSELILESTYESPCRSETEQEDPESIMKSTSERPLRSFVLNSEGSSSGDSEPEGESNIVDDDLLLHPDFVEPLPDDEFTIFVKNDLRYRGYPMPTRLEGGMHLVNTFEEEFAEDTWCKLSKRVASNASRSVVSLASFKGKERLFACTGVFIDFNESTSRVLTSACLVRNSADENKIADNLEIEVYLPNGQSFRGTLKHYSFTYNVAVVSIVGFHCLRTAEFHRPVHIKPQMEVVAIGRVFQSRKLMPTSGVVADKESKLDCKELMIATCKITKAGIGGPLIDLDGNFIGMNFYGMKETHFLPKGIILELLKIFDAERSVADKPNRWHVPMPRWSYPSRRAPRGGSFFRLE